MATWWELLIPVAAAIGGSAVTGFVQYTTIRAQREHERTLRFLDERKDSYARFLRLVHGFVNVSEELDSWDRKLEVVKAEDESGHERLQAIQVQIGSTTITAENVDSLSQQMTEWEAERDQILETVEKNNEITAQSKAKSAELRSKIETLTAEANEFYYTLRLVAAAPVREAASKIIHQMSERLAGRLSVKEIRDAMREFEEAARKDLL